MIQKPHKIVVVFIVVSRVRVLLMFCFEKKLTFCISCQFFASIGPPKTFSISTSFVS